MRLDFDERLDSEYPVAPECEVNDRDCSFEVAAICHECGRKLCVDCRIGVRHQPQPAVYDTEAGDAEGRLQYHCPECLDSHTLDRTRVGAGGGGVFLGVLVVVLGIVTAPVLALLGVPLVLGGGWLLRHEYRLKRRDDPEYGLSSMW
ncbi:MAG: hypothetical protein ABEH80_01695 [Halobaculum sp.]